MVRIDIDREDAKTIHVDRASSKFRINDPTAFEITIGPVRIVFEDEADAVELARKILLRMGEEASPLDSGPMVAESTAEARELMMDALNAVPRGDYVMTEERQRIPGTLINGHLIEKAVAEDREVCAKLCEHVASDCKLGDPRDVRAFNLLNRAAVLIRGDAR